MSNTIDHAANRHPVFGGDVVISTYADKMHVISHQYSESPESATLRNSSGDTVARVWYDLEQSKTLSLTCVAVGADSAGGIANNDPFTAGTALTLTSTQHAHIAGNWRVTSCEQSVSNTEFATWTINLVPELS